jgi:hypothetical protein
LTRCIVIMAKIVKLTPDTAPLPEGTDGGQFAVNTTTKTARVIGTARTFTFDEAKGWVEDKPAA